MKIRKNKPVNNEPTIVTGSHLTVTTWPDGKTELQWDDDALLRDVRQAILKYESTIPVTKKTTRKKKST